MHTLRTSLLGALVLCIVGAGGGLVWNHFNPAGVPLTTQTPTGDPDDPASSPYWSAAKLPAEKKISLADARDLLRDGRVFFIDARAPEDYAKRRIAGAYNVYQKKFAEHSAELLNVLRTVAPPDREAFPTGYPVVTYCDNHTCDMAAIVLENLKAVGIQNVRCLFMGLDGWVRAKHPVAELENGKLVEKRGDAVRQLAEPPVPVTPITWLVVWMALPFVIAALLTSWLWRRRRAAAWFGLVSRLAIGALFIAASWFKLTGPEDFGQMVSCYDLVPRSVLPAFVVTLPAIELLAGVLLILGLFTRAAATVLIAMLVGFMVAIFSLLARNLGCSCGCFPVPYPASWTRIYEDAAFLLPAILAWAFGARTGLDALRRRRRDVNEA